MTRAKMNARKRYWKFVTTTQDAFASKVIHSNVKPKDIVKETMLSPATVSRFLDIGIGKSKIKPYSYMHGPYATTLFAIADAINLEFRIMRKKG